MKRLTGTCAALISVALMSTHADSMPLTSRARRAAPMSCVLLGSGGSLPTPQRHVTSLAVRTGGRIYLFDAGEGTQVLFQSHKLNADRLRLIAISNLSTEHVAGLPTMLAFKARSKNTTPLTILGPPGLKRHVSGLMHDLGIAARYPLSVVDWPADQAKDAYRDDQVSVTGLPLNHPKPTLGYRLDQTAAHAFKVSKAALNGTANGAAHRQRAIAMALNRAGVLDQPNGSPRQGRSVAYVIDTSPTENIGALIKGVGAAFVESTYRRRDRTTARKSGHLTAQDAGMFAEIGKPAKLILMHFNPPASHREVGQLESEAQRLYPRAVAGSDGLTLDVFAAD